MIYTSREPHKRIDTVALCRRIDDIVRPVFDPRGQLIGERMNQLNTIERNYVREGGDWLDVSEAAGRDYWPATPSAVSRLWNLTSPVFYDWQTALAYMEQHLKDAEAAMKLVSGPPDPTVWNWYPFGEDALCGIAGHSSAPLTRVVIWHYYARCWMDGALAMLAVEEFHRDHGAYPDRLDELVPDYLPRLPIDYADGQTMRYRREGDGFLLYSIGHDRVDDGGEKPDPYAGGVRDIVYSRERRPEVLP